MSNEQEQVVGIEEALAKGYVAYAEAAHRSMTDSYHDLDFTNCVLDKINPQPEWLSQVTDANSLAEFYRLIKNADMKTAEEIAKRIEREQKVTIASFESFVKNLIDTCKAYGDIEDVQEEAQGE